MPTPPYTPPPYTTLSQDALSLLRLVQQPFATTLQHFSDRGCDQVTLDDAALAAFLRALPRATVLAALDLDISPSDAPIPCAVTHMGDPPPVGSQAWWQRAQIAPPAACPICRDTQVVCGCAAALPAVPAPLDGELPSAWNARPQPGTVCACDAHPSIHVADAACGAGREESPV